VIRVWEHEDMAHAADQIELKVRSAKGLVGSRHPIDNTYGAGAGGGS
jgi:hypothetical protein